MTLSDGDRVVYAFRRNVVVAASAGTGKTHRLTALYVLLALGLTSTGEADERIAAPPISPERIVATTFSRAAALEIGTRIEQALRTLAAWDGLWPAEARAEADGTVGDRPGSAIPFADILRARHDLLGGATPVDAIRSRAREALARWHAARIDTLHGLAREIVLESAMALGLPPGSRILDEEESRALGELAIDETLGAALASGGERASAARDLVTACGSVFAARDQVLRLLDRLDEEGLAPSGLALADHAAEARSLRAELHRVALQSAAAGSPAFRASAGVLAAVLGRAPEASGDLRDVSDEAAEALVELFSLRAPPSSKRTSADDDLAAFRKNVGTSADTNPGRAHKLVALLRTAPELALRERRLVSLLDDAQVRLQLARKRARSLSFGDLLRTARDGLRDRPDFARRVRSGIDALLVDEFQDTSRVQRDLVYLLRERDDAARARGLGAPPRADGIAPRGLFLVGDRKQSIYGFRGADVSVFCQICAELAGEAAGAALALPRASWSASPSADFVALCESRRSGSNVLAFVNAFAERDFAQDRAPGAPARDFEIVYGPAEQLVAVHGDGDGARDRDGASADAEDAVVLLRDDGSTPEDADPLVRDSAGPAREALVAAAFVLGEVREHARARWRDVAILTRRRSTIPLIELALTRLDVPYVVAGRALYEAMEVRDVAAMLRLVLDPRDRLALATVLRGPVVALSDAALTGLSAKGRGLTLAFQGRRSRSESGTLADASRLDPDEAARLEEFRTRYNDVRRAALRLPPGEAIRLCVQAFDLDRLLAALPRAEARIGNVDRLVAIARRRGGTLASFVHWLERRIREETDEAEAAVFSPDDDAVRLTTIHASKGLDFPVVVLVDLNAEPRASSPGIGLAPSPTGAPLLVVRHFGAKTPAGPAELLDPEPIALPTGVLRTAQAEARAREAAERRRLTYVAMTRARRTLVLVGADGTPRPASAWRSLAHGMRDPELVARITRAVEAPTLLATFGREPGPSNVANDVSVAKALDVTTPSTARASLCRTVAIATTPLSLFGQCPRRFRLRVLLGLDEPVATGQLDLFAAREGPPEPAEIAATGPDPRALGRAAHRVLMRWPRERWGSQPDANEIRRRLEDEGLPTDAAETLRIADAIDCFIGGAYARELRASDAVLHREEPFVVVCRAETPPDLALRGAMDLLVVRPRGPIDVVDYKLSRPRPDAGSYAFQLRAYAIAARRRFPKRPIRAGVLFLGTEEPVWLRGEQGDSTLGEPDHDRFEDDLRALARRFAEARAGDRWEGVPLEVCRAEHCGFVPVCHGPRADSTGPRPT